MEVNYYTCYLKAYLVEVNDPLKNDENFIEDRANYASEAFEQQRLAGVSPICAQELAMSILMEGFDFT